MRRVGKSTLVEQFAKNEYDTYILIDFNKASKRVISLFDDLMDLDFIFLQLQAIYNVNLIARNSVIIFDEVQACPKARQAIKYLVADGRYDYIETGSLISITKNTKDITIPSEEERVTLQPMDYEEFRWAMGDTVSIPLLKQFFDKRIMLSQAHRTKMRELRLYMLVGGMPQAVNEYLETNNLSMVDLVKRDIKMFCADTGLFITLAFWDKSFTENVIYEKLLSDKLSANLGYVYENLVAQMLTASGNKLFYYSWAKDATHNYEIDFLLSSGAKICPIEVKSSGYKSHASLDAFCEKFSKNVGKRYLLYTKDMAKDESTLLLPLYMTPFLLQRRTFSYFLAYFSIIYRTFATQ